jgi:hypothetical protein
VSYLPICKDVALQTAYILDAGPGIDSIVDIDVLLALWRSGVLHYYTIPMHTPIILKTSCSIKRYISVCVWLVKPNNPLADPGQAKSWTAMLIRVTAESKSPI